MKDINQWVEGDWIAAIAAIALFAVLAVGGLIAARKSDEFASHPRGLFVLFYAEMWERFSYYGMRGFLILYMTASPELGGLGLATPVAAAIYGTYTSSVYLLGLLGGWLADRLIGQRRAVLYGGLLIASGHFSLAFPAMATFYLGLVLIVIGTVLLKTNISVIVGSLVPPLPSTAISPWPMARRTPPKNTALRWPSQRSAMTPPSTGVM